MMGLVLIGFSSVPCFLVLEMSASPSVSFHLNVLCESGDDIYKSSAHTCRTCSFSGWYGWVSLTTYSETSSRIKNRVQEGHTTQITGPQWRSLGFQK